MHSRFTRALAALTLALVLAVPTMVSAELGNSGKITEALNTDMISNITLDVRGLNVMFHETSDNETARAELDATVVGIDSADVTYGLTVNDNEDGSGINIQAYHDQDKTVIGINSITLNIYIPKTGVEMMTVTMQDSDLSIGEFTINEINAKATGGKISFTKTTLPTMTLEGNDTGMNLEGDFTNITITAATQGVKLTSHTVPQMMMITMTSADAQIKIPEESAFALNYSLTDGKFSTNFMNDYNEASGSVTNGAGTYTYTLNATNGNIKLEK